MIHLCRLWVVDRLTEIANRLTDVSGVVGVCLGGSRARGTHVPDSDFDLGLYYRLPMDTAALRLLAAELTGGPVEVTEPGGWGPWVDGGAWLTVDGHRIDWIYRDLDRVHRIWQQCRAGQFEIGTQPGHPLGVYSHAYAGEVALGHVLADPSGELQTLQGQTRHYPEPLREALIDNAQWEAPFILAGARKGQLAVMSSTSPAASSELSDFSCMRSTRIPGPGCSTRRERYGPQANLPLPPPISPTGLTSCLPHSAPLRTRSLPLSTTQTD